jgi:hypothetical protein
MQKKRPNSARQLRLEAADLRAMIDGLRELRALAGEHG